MAASGRSKTDSVMSTASSPVFVQQRNLSGLLGILADGVAVERQQRA
jgi:hypothetical protein